MLGNVIGSVYAFRAHRSKHFQPPLYPRPRSNDDDPKPDGQHRIGGDGDAIAAVTGGIADPRFGVPASIAETRSAYLPADIQAVMVRLYEAAGCAWPIARCSPRG